MTDRIDQFKAEIQEMKVKMPSHATSNRDPLLIRAGAAAMAVGLGLAIVAYFLSHGTTEPLEQNDYQILSIIGLALAVVGAAVYVRAAMAQFLRFWLARLIHEQKSGSPDRGSTS